jgi:hypothetical protein
MIDDIERAMKAAERRGSLIGDIAKALVFLGALAILCSWAVGCDPADSGHECFVKCRDSIACYQGKLSPSCHDCVIECLKAREPKGDCYNGVCG